MFKALFSKKFSKKRPIPKTTTPEIMGLRLGGAFELDDLKLRLIEPRLVVENVAPTQLIQAVGVVKLDESATVLRYYTDDDAFLQVLLTGGMTENHVADVKLWHFYETQGIASDTEWEQVINSRISRPQVCFEGSQYQRVWSSTGDNSPPVAMTERTYSAGEAESETDQFVMLYERDVGDGFFEYLTYAGEEKIINHRADRCLVISTAFDVKAADLHIVG